MRRAILLASAAVALGAGVRPSQGAYEYSTGEIDALRAKKVLNLAEVQAAIGFTNIEADPYPKLWYDTVIDTERQCYVVFPDMADRSTYELKTMTPAEIQAYAPGRHKLTHRTPCGVCSQLNDLAVYLAVRDLTTPVRKCALKLFEGPTINCLMDLGFSRECSRIWFWNTKNTRKLHMQGGCFGVCIMHVFSDNNQPEGIYNPCKPPGGATEGREMNELSTGEHLNSFTPSVPEHRRQLCLPCTSWNCCKNCCTPAPVKEDEYGFCRNTINGKPACSPEQWQNGKYRLNPCLQCDECRSGPIFQKIAGRTRRASGIISAIERPGVVEIVHNYDNSF